MGLFTFQSNAKISNSPISDINILYKTIEITHKDNIQKAIDSLSIEGGKIKLLAGVYNIYTEIQLKSNVTIEGAGIDKTFLKLNKGVFHGLVAIANDENITNLTLKNFSLYANLNKGNAIFLESTKNYCINNIVIKNIKVHGSTHNNIVINSGNHGIYDDILLSEVETFNANDNGIIIGDSKNLKVYNCFSHDNGDKGLEFSTDFAEISNNKFINNHGVNNDGVGIKFLNANHIYMHDNLFENNSAYAIKMSMSRKAKQYFHFENNIIKGTSIDSIAPFQAYITSTEYYPYAQVIVRNNTIIGYKGKKAITNMMWIYKSDNTYAFGDNIISVINKIEDLNLKKYNYEKEPLSYNVGWHSWIN